MQSVNKIDYRIQKSNTNLVSHPLVCKLSSGFAQYCPILNYFLIIFSTGIVFFFLKITLNVFFFQYTKEHTLVANVQQRMLSPPRHLILSIIVVRVRVYSAPILYFYFGLMFVINTCHHESVNLLQALYFYLLDYNIHNSCIEPCVYLHLLHTSI